MKISNKLESAKKITELNLNKFPEEVFKKGEKEKDLEFIKKYPTKYYALRDKSKPRGKFKLKVTREKILQVILTII